MKAVHSFKEDKGLLWVSCSECERGGNGNAVDKCSCGWKAHKFNKKGCFSGHLMAKYTID